MKKFLTLIFILILNLGVAQAQVYKTAAGEKIDFKNLTGRWVIVNYWASWCGTCVAELPVLSELSKNKELNVAVFGVHWGSLSAQELLDLKKQYKITYPLLLTDPRTELGVKKLDFIPVTVFVNPAGKVHKTVTGKISLAEIKKIIK